MSIAEALFAWAAENLSKLPRKSELAKAFRYMHSRWKGLLRGFDHGRLALDNNPAERALRGVAIGRKNYLFAGSDAGGRRAAALYSLIETAKLNRVNPQHHLANVLGRNADHRPGRLLKLQPWNWKPRGLLLLCPQKVRIAGMATTVPEGTAGGARSPEAHS